MRQMVLDLALLNRFNTLRQKAHKRDPNLIHYLEAEGFKTAQGRSYQLSVTSLLSTRLGISKIVMKNICRATVGVAGLMKEFGNGVICVLPKGTSSKYVVFPAWVNSLLTMTYCISSVISE
jgi:hypothetical protein